MDPLTPPLVLIEKVYPSSSCRYVTYLSECQTEPSTMQIEIRRFGTTEVRFINTFDYHDSIPMSGLRMERPCGAIMCMELNLPFKYAYNH